GLSLAEVQGIVSAAEAAAGRIRGVIRLPLGSRARMAIAVADAQGEILALFRMPDSTVFSLDVAVAKARNVAYLSRVGLPPLPPGTAITNRTLGFGAQPLFPSGIDGSSSGPFFGLFQQDLANPCRLGGDPAGPYRNGLVFFAGSVPLYRGSTLVGGLGVSGDGIEQDDYVSFFGAQGFLPPEALRADRFKVGGVRLPFLKFPRNPEG
ncbi:MAG TPA: heme-binding protein, partial [Thermoanaerobaculia bacterium]|nr:heme-binding protein [Thermoanaerobaculia bacterium]